MLLTCPTCRSGLEVPDGTTALVRCPACKAVFAPAAAAGPEGGPEEGPAAPPRRGPGRHEYDEDRDPRKKRAARGDRGGGETQGPVNRDFDPPDEREERRRKKGRASAEYDGLGAEEKAARRAAFERAAWGAKLIWASFGLYMASLVIVTVYFFQSAFTAPRWGLIVFAGLLGSLNWGLAAVGIGLCLSGPRVPGHWGYGIAAAVATFVHLVLLLVVVGQGREFGIGRADGGSGVRWDMIPTRLNATMYYLTVVVYSHEQGITPKGAMVLSMITGVAETVRTVLVLMFLSCLARAALDEDLAHKCTRAAGIASAGPGLLGLLIFLFVAGVVETNAGVNMFTNILFLTVQMGLYSVVNGVMLPSYLAAREVADACDEPFQSLIPQL